MLENSWRGTRKSSNAANASNHSAATPSCGEPGRLELSGDVLLAVRIARLCIMADRSNHRLELFWLYHARIPELQREATHCEGDRRWSREASKMGLGDTRRQPAPKAVRDTPGR